MPEVGRSIGQVLEQVGQSFTLIRSVLVACDAVLLVGLVFVSSGSSCRVCAIVRAWLCILGRFGQFSDFSIP